MTVTGLFFILLKQDKQAVNPKVHTDGFPAFLFTPLSFTSLLILELQETIPCSALTHSMICHVFIWPSGLHLSSQSEACNEYYKQNYWKSLLSLVKTEVLYVHYKLNKCFRAIHSWQQCKKKWELWLLNLCKDWFSSKQSIWSRLP